MKIIFFGDSNWAALSLYKLIQDGHTIPAVVIRKHPSDITLQQAAAEYGIQILQPDNVNSGAFRNTIKSLSPDLNLSCSYDQIIRKPILHSAPLGFANVHAGDLPFYRGRNVINWAIINGETHIGITVHYMDESIDTGDIISQTTIPIEWSHTYNDVLQNVTSAIPETLSEAVTKIGLAAPNSTPQNSSQGTYFCKRDWGDEWIDWSDTSLNIYNKIRAITKPGPGERTLYEEQTVIIWSAQYNPLWPKYIATPGQVVGRDTSGCFVKTGDSTILICEVQFLNEAITKATWKIGTRLCLDIQQQLSNLQNRIAYLEKLLLDNK